MDGQKDAKLLERTLKSSSLRSRRYERNFESAVQRCFQPNQTRRGVLHHWAQVLDISFETFALFASTFGYDFLTRHTGSIPQLLSKLKEAEIQARIERHDVLVARADRLRKLGRIFAANLGGG